MPRIGKDVVQTLSRAFSRRREVLAAYIFGSATSGRTRPDSDIDVAVLIDEKRLRKHPLYYRLDLISDLTTALGRADVDVVLMNEAPPDLAQNIITKGQRVFERSRSARVAFQVRTLNLFMDTEPMRRTYLRYLKRRYLKSVKRG
jgi:predicted nucleotidyltransferase